jgi:hypothetical protein
MCAYSREENTTNFCPSLTTILRCCDRYCYLPLAMFCPGAVEILMTLFGGENSLDTNEEEPDNPPAATSTDSKLSGMRVPVRPRSPSRAPLSQQEHQSQQWRAGRKLGAHGVAHGVAHRGGGVGAQKGLQTNSTVLEERHQLEQRGSTPQDESVLGGGSSYSSRVQRLCGCLALCLCLVAFQQKFIQQLRTWRDDKSVLLNCIR